MMRTELNDALKTAMKAKEDQAVQTIRLILASLKDRDIAARSKGNMEGITDDEILSLLQSMVKQRKESITLYEQGGRLELAQQEAAEIEVINRFLPEPMTDEDMAKAVELAMSEIGAASLKDMGKTMGLLKERHAGVMDFAAASKMVKERLAQ
ncbi:MAG: GatB/YqeY domain-containing protein [Magnetovibrionaceae bacterium]